MATHGKEVLPHPRVRLGQMRGSIISDGFFYFIPIHSDVYSDVVIHPHSDDMGDRRVNLLTSDVTPSISYTALFVVPDATTCRRLDIPDV